MKGAAPVDNVLKSSNLSKYSVCVRRRACGFLPLSGKVYREMKKPWGGRFQRDTDGAVEQFTESVSFDTRLYQEDIEANIAHAEMLARCGLINEAEKQAIKTALAEIRSEIEEGRFEFSEKLEDVHMNIEAALIQRTGEAGQKLHTARSRNDQVAADTRLWTRRCLSEIDGLLAECQKALVRCAEEHENLLMPGLTHLQHAQPLLLAHVLLAYVEMLERDRARLADCRKRVNISPLGACALAGTSLPIDVEFTAGKLGFDGVFSNSVDAVSDRDFVIEFLADLALIACHMSRLAEDWLLWASREYDFLDLDESFCTGSSIMPQKKNPDVLELIRGKCGRVYGCLTAVLTLMKGLPLSYNRDMQEDKRALFDAADEVRASLSILAQMVARVAFKEEHMEEACSRGYLDATALADYLVRKGVPFREAHQTVGGIVRRAAARGVPLAEMTLEEMSDFDERIAEDVYEALGMRNCVQNYRSRGSSSPPEVERQLAQWKSRLQMGQ